MDVGGEKSGERGYVPRAPLRARDVAGSISSSRHKAAAREQQDLGVIAIAPRRAISTIGNNRWHDLRERASRWSNLGASVAEKFVARSRAQSTVVGISADDNHHAAMKRTIDA